MLSKTELLFGAVRHVLVGLNVVDSFLDLLLTCSLTYCGPIIDLLLTYCGIIVDLLLTNC